MLLIRDVNQKLYIDGKYRQTIISCMRKKSHLTIVSYVAPKSDFL